MLYLTIKALHIIGFVSWFAGLFYTVRLFIYDVEAGARPESERDVLQAQLRVMQKRLWQIITTPAMVFTLVFGLWLLWLYVEAGGGKLLPWLHVKLTLLVLLVGYHHVLGRVRKKLQAGNCTWTSLQLRMLNEGATVFLVAIVFVAVFKDALNALIATLGFIIFGVLLMLVVQAMRRVGH